MRYQNNLLSVTNNIINYKEVSDIVQSIIKNNKYQIF